MQISLFLAGLALLSLFCLPQKAIAQGEPLGFLERFALSEQRDKALEELIPGTPDYFYYQVLHHQNLGRVAEARALLQTWIDKSGLNGLSKPLLTRQALLEYASNPDATVEYLQREFQIVTNHPAPKKDEAAELATKLDPAILDWNRILRETIQSTGLDTIEDAALPDALESVPNIDTLRRWFARSHRIDTPKLMDRLVEELTAIHSQGFGWAPIHRELTLAQLEELRKRIPTIDQNANYVVEVLRRLQPTDDESLQDADVRKRHLDRMEAFVLGLPELHNSLIASVLHQRLVFDLEQGTPDRERFKRYLRLPNQRPICTQAYREWSQKRPLVDWNAAYPIRYLDRPIGDDRQLIEKYLDVFFRTDANVDDFSEWLERGYLQTFFATTKILHGIGDPKTYYAQLSPEAQKELAERIEVRFAPTNPTTYKSDEKVRLEIDLKNTPELFVRVYRLNARNILSKQMTPISTAIDLDGVVPNVERKLNYAQRNDRRHREILELPELEGLGMWIVEVLAGGQRSRALIQKGKLQSIQTISDAGQLLRIVDAAGNHVPTAKVLLREREFAPAEDGWILIPFEQSTQAKGILLCDGNFAVLEPLQHLAEAYDFQADFLVDPQSVLSGNRAAIVVRARLLAHNQPLPLSNLSEIELIAKCTDLDGISTTQQFKNLKLNDQQELTQEFAVPPRLAQIDWTLQAKIREVRTDTVRSLAANHTTRVNDFSKTGYVFDSYLNRTSEGYRLELRGRNGEPIPRTPVDIEVKLYGIQPTRNIRLASDASGEIELGTLVGVERFWVTSAQSQRRMYALPKSSMDWPQKIHATTGQPIRVTGPLAQENLVGAQVGVESLKRQARRFSLFELRSGLAMADQSEKIKPLAGVLEIAGLDAGNYALLDHEQGTRLDIEITQGEQRDAWLVGKNRTLAKTPVDTLAITNTKLDGNHLQIDLVGVDPSTRLLVVAAPFAHGETELWLRRTQRPFAPSVRRERPSSFYVDSMKLDEEYQYVLARQQVMKLLGSSLAHPTVLLNPWELSATRNENQLAQAGDAIAEKSNAPAAVPGAPMAADAGRVANAAGESRDYGFLGLGAQLLVNIRPNQNGSIAIGLPEFEGVSDLAVIALSEDMTASTRIALPWKGPRKLADRRLQESLDDQKHFIQKESVYSIDANVAKDLGDVGVTRIRSYTSIADLIPMLDSILQGAPQFRRYDFLKTWSTLTDAQKQDRYSEFACHELHLFLRKHDRAFFDRVVRPHLANKTPRQFIDDWLLDQDLTPYTAPWRYQQLNTTERVLLGKSFEAKREGLIRLFENSIAAQPVPLEMQTQWFGQALRTSELDFAKRDAGYFFDENRLLEREELGIRPGKPSGGGRLSGGMGSGGMGGGGMGGMPGTKEFAGGSGGLDGVEGAPGAADLKAKASDPRELAESLQRRETRGRGALRDLAKDKAGKSESLALGLESKVGEGRDASGDPATDSPNFEPEMRGLSLNRETDRYDRYFGANATRRKRVELGKQIQFFEPLAATRKWAESQFDQVLLANQNPSLVTPGPFWIDTLKLPEGQLSENLHFAARNSNEALLALAFVDLPLESEQGKLNIEDGRWIYQHSGKTLAYVQGIIGIEAAEPKSKVLLSENLYLANADTTAAPVNRQELVVGVPYRDRVVLTNPTGNPMRVQILMQIPQGAIPLEAGRSVTVREFQLAPFSTQETSHVFYFPASGDFQQYGARASSDGTYLAHVNSEPVKVLDAPLRVDDTSWEYVAAWGSNDQVLAALDRVNLAKIDLGLIAWRMNDKTFWSDVLAKLDRFGIYHPTLWSYSLTHRDEPRIKECLEANNAIVTEVSPVFRCSLMNIDDESRLKLEHLDFRPIVVARTHRLGRDWKILNDGLATQYQEWLKLLAYQPKILPRHRLSLVYYQLIQNRVEEALENFKRVDRASLVTGKETTEAQMQYDYFDAYFAMRTGAWDRAKELAAKYAQYPVPRWNVWFGQVAQQLKEREELQQGLAAVQNVQAVAPVKEEGNSGDGGDEGKYANDAQRELAGGREAELASGAAKLPGLEVASQEGQIWIQHRNIDAVQVNLYFIDVELMFSRNPFVGQNQTRSAVIEPNRTQRLEVPSKGTWEKTEWKIPDEFKNRNMILEVVSGGIVRSLPVYSNSLSVNLAAPLGRLQVLGASNKHPLEGAYVKVYAKHNDGSIRFYKDGYTDLRGVFDYASLSTDEWSTVARYSILVIHPELGTWIQESEPVSK